MLLIFLLLTQAPSTTPPETSPNCGMSDSAQALASLITEHPDQKRPQLDCNELLTQIANQRAESLLNGTADDGITPNQIVIKGGYRFASFYPPTGNQVEAVAKNKGNTTDVINYFKQSNQHHDLIFGSGEFFGRQNEFGVGYFQNEFGQTQYVVLMAEPYTRQKIVFKQKLQPPSTQMLDHVECPKQWRRSNDPKIQLACSEKAKDKKRKRQQD